MSDVRNVNISITTSSATFDTDDIVQVDITRGITDGSFGIGFTHSDMLRFTAVSSAKLAKKTRCAATINPGGRFGTYYVEECVRDGSQINVTAFDAMYYQGNAHVKFGGKSSIHLDKLTFPCMMQDVLDYICTLRNMTCSFQCQEFTVPKKPKKPDGTYYTVRELIGFIAASHGCNAKFDNQEHLVFQPFTESSEEITASDAVDFTLDDGEPFEVTGLLFHVDSETDVYIDDVPGSEYDEDDEGVVKCYNPLATVEIANYAWTQIGGLAYYSGSITMRGSGAVNCGDVLTVENLKYPADTEEYMLCVTEISYSISAETGFMMTMTSTAGKDDNGTPPVGSSKTEAYGAVTDPAQESGADVKFSDLWFKTDSNGNIESVSKRTQNDNTTQPEWTPIGTVGGSGGVGENVGDHNERFNGYVNGTDGHIIRSGDYNHAEGFKNTIQSESYSHAEGYQNTAQGGSYNHIEGDYNTVTASNRAHVGGFRNTVTGASCSIVSGYMNTAINSISYDIISGVCNEAHNVDRAIVIGDSNFVAAISSAIVCGQYADTRTITTPDNGDLRFLIGGSQALGNVLYITHKGNVYAKGSYNSTGADYAEYFEWADGNPDNEYRCGMLVALEGEKIVPAHGDDILGVVSAAPSVVGNSASLTWNGKFVKNVYGEIITTPHGEPILNPDYDPEKKYIPREQRPEWAAVGLVGRLIVRDNGTCKPNGYVSARNGIGTASLSPTNIRVLRRIDEKHVEVFIRQ